MRALLLTLASVGLLVSVPASAFAAMMHHGFGGAFTIRDWLTLLSPIPFALLFLVGLAYRSTK
jgi:hypothetical protein